jgi:hypothetical protein
VHFIQGTQRQTDELRKRDKQLRCPDLLVLSALFTVRDADRRMRARLPVHALDLLISAR